MKILFWLFTGFDRHVTSEHLLLADIEQLCKAGHSVHIIQKNTGGDLPYIPLKISDYSVSTDVIKTEATNKGNFIARYLLELKYLLACTKYINQEYDAIFIQSTPVAGFAVKIVRKKCPKAIITYNVQDVFPYNAVSVGRLRKNSLIYQILSKIQKEGYKDSDHIITISEDMKDTIVKEGAEANKIEVVYNWSFQDELYEGIDCSKVAYMFDANFFNVVYAGNIGVMQNVDQIIEAAILMRDDNSVWFHIIGDGGSKTRLEEKAVKHQIKNISFWPLQPAELAPLIYCSADVNIIPLRKNVYKTALPSKTATCLGAQKPIIFAIGKDSKFGQQVMKETGCIVIEPDNPNELVKAIRSVQNSGGAQNTDEFYLKYCSITKNSRRYAEIITRKN